jgi:hypothetical protein
LLDSNIATVTFLVENINDPPSMDPIEDVVTDEGNLVFLTIAVNDPDLPADELSFALDTGSPEGAAVDGSGTLTWTPNEAQGPGMFPLTVIVTDGGGLSDAQSFTITVNEVASAPVLDAVDDQVIDEGALLTFDLTATDVDIPASDLAFTLEGIPPGAEFAGATFVWTPTEEQGGMLFMLTATVTDGDGLSDANTFTVTAREVDTPPVLDQIDDRVIAEGELLTFTAFASDTDIPVNILTFSLDTGAPIGAAVAADGVFTWTPTEAQGPFVHGLTLRVTDDTGQSAARSFTVTVLEDEIIDAGPAADDGMPDTFTIGRNNDSVVIAVNGLSAFDQPLASIPTLTFNGSTDDDLLVVDFSSGSPIPAGGIVYNGGGPGDDDTLSLTGASAASVTYIFFDASSGTVEVDGGLISFSGLEPIVDDLAAAERSFNFGDLGNDIVLTVGSQRSVLTSPSSESVDFLNPSSVLTLNSGAGDDSITVVAAGDPTFDIVIDAGGGNNTINGTAGVVSSVVTGPAGDDTISVIEASGTVTATVNGVTSTLSGPKHLEVLALGGDDAITLEGVTNPVRVEGGQGADQVDATRTRAPCAAAVVTIISTVARATTGWDCRNRSPLPTGASTRPAGPPLLTAPAPRKAAPILAASTRTMTAHRPHLRLSGPRPPRSFLDPPPSGWRWPTMRPSKSPTARWHFGLTPTAEVSTRPCLPKTTMAGETAVSSTSV